MRPELYAVWFRMSSAWSAINVLDWRAPLIAEFDRFVEGYRMAFDPDPGNTVPHAFEHYIKVIAPQLEKTRERLSEDSIERRMAIREVSDMLLRLVADTPIGSEERENLLFGLGRHFIEELDDAGLLSNEVPLSEEYRRPGIEQQYALVA